jgi:hypothetical protein
MPKHGCLLIPAVLAAFIWVAAASPLLARDVRISGDFEYTASAVETTNKASGDITESEHSRFSQLYDLDISRRLFPYLQFNGGGLFELGEAANDVNGSRTESEEKIIRPYLELLLSNPLYRAGAGYRKTEIERSATDLRTTSNFLEEYSTRLGWRPADFPQLDLNFTRSLIYDEPRTSDLVTDTFDLKSRYEYKDLFFNYFFTHRDASNELENSQRLTTSHNGSVQYARQLLANRLGVDAGVRLFHSNIDLTGTEEFRQQTQSPGTVFVWTQKDPDHTNDMGQVDEFNPLGDGVDLAPNSETSLRLEFGVPTELDTIHIVPAEEIIGIPEGLNIPQVFRSNDREGWTRVDVGPGWAYDPQSKSFVVSLLAPIETRYLKIVLTTSLNAKKIHIIGLQALTTISLTGRPGAAFEAFEQNYNLGLNWRLTDRTSSRYDFYYQNRSSEPGGRERTLLTNGVNLSHAFNPIFSGSTRLLRSDATDGNAAETGYEYSASVQGKYLDTFRQTLSYSGSRIRTGEGSGSGNSVLLRNVADLYLNWSAILDFGYAWNEPVNEGRSTSKLIRAGTHLQPHRKTDINLDYTIVLSSPENGRESRKDTGSLRFLFVPVRSVSLFAGLTSITEEGEEPLLIQDYSLGWSPFPEGALQFSFGYGTSLLRDGEQETYTSLARWQVARGIFLDFNYSFGTFETSSERSEFDSYSAKLRVTF